MRAVLVCSAVDMSGHAGYPNNTEGWGILRLDRALMFTGQRPQPGRPRHPQHLRAARRGELHPALHDQPGIPAAARRAGLHRRTGTTGAVRTLVNNLNLRVLDPAGVRYDGNDFDPATGRSRAGSTSAGDSVNTIEVVMVDNAAAGRVGDHRERHGGDRQPAGLRPGDHRDRAAGGRQQQLLRRQRRVRRPAAPRRRCPARLARPHPRPGRLRRSGHGRVLGRLLEGRSTGRHPGRALAPAAPDAPPGLPPAGGPADRDPANTTDDEHGEDQPWP